MVAGLKATCQRLDGSMENDSLAEPGDGGSFEFFLALFCFFAIGGGLAFFAARKQSRCPNCGKHQITKKRKQACFPNQRSEDRRYYLYRAGTADIHSCVATKVMTMIITIGVAAEAVRLSVASEEVEVSEEAEVLAAAASEEEWAEAAVPAPGSKTRNNQIINFNKKTRNMKKSIIIILAVVAILVIWAVSVYNGLVTMDENVTGQWANVKVNTNVVQT